jgi:hypothetical protein
VHNRPANLDGLRLTAISDTGCWGDGSNGLPCPSLGIGGSTRPRPTTSTSLKRHVHEPIWSHRPMSGRVYRSTQTRTDLSSRRATARRRRNGGLPDDSTHSRRRPWHARGGRQRRPGADSLPEVIHVRVRGPAGRRCLRTPGKPSRRRPSWRGQWRRRCVSLGPAVTTSPHQSHRRRLPHG